MKPSKPHANGLLHHWKKRFEVNEQSNRLELSEVEQLKLELRQVKRALQIVRQERDILKQNGEHLSIFYCFCGDIM